MQLRVLQVILQSPCVFGLPITSSCLAQTHGSIEQLYAKQKFVAGDALDGQDEERIKIEDHAGGLLLETLLTFLDTWIPR